MIMTYYPLSVQEADKIESLCPLASKLFNFIRTRCPFEHSRPSFSVDDLVARYGAHRDTILRLLRELKAIELLPSQLHARILEFGSQVRRRVESPVKKPDRPKVERSPRSSEAIQKDRHDLSPNRNPAPDKGSTVTNNRSLNLNQNNGETPGNEQGWFGQIFAAIEEAGIRANNTIQTTIHRLHRDFGPAAAAKRVELAIESFREQSEKGNVKNPGGFLNAALRRTFTPNDDGYRERKSKEKFGASQPAPGRSPSPASAAPSPGAASSPALPVPPALDLFELQQQCDPLILGGQRSLVAERLQEEIAFGNLNAIRSLLRMRRDWGFNLENNRITSKGQSARA